MELDVAERDRLRALHDLAVLDTAPEPEFDRIVQLAAKLFDAPIALVSLVDRDRQWFKARVGLAACETARGISFCTHAISGVDVLDVPNATLDNLFANNPLVIGPPHIRAYAGAPLVTNHGRALGTLCVIHSSPRLPLSPAQHSLLSDLAALVVDLLELRRGRVYQRVSELIASTTSDAVVCADPANTIVYWNRAAEAMFGWTATEAVGRSLDIIMPERFRSAHRGGLARMAAGATPKLVGTVVEVPASRRDGTEFPIELSLAMWRDGRLPSPAGFAATIRDVSARVALEADRERARRLLDAVVESMPTALFVKEPAEHRFVLVNRAFEELTQLDRATVIGRSDRDFFPPEEADSFVALDAEVLASKAMSVVEERLTRADGSTRLLRTKKLAIGTRSADDPTHLLGIADDITERQQAQERLSYLAHHDPLTGLPNRTRLEAELAALVERARARNKLVGVFYLDLDGFKAVNDASGHAQGDALLRAVADRLRRSAGSKGLVARLAGDEFVVAQAFARPELAGRFAARLLDELAAPYGLEAGRAEVGASVGVALAPADGGDVADLLRKADMAMYRAKREGGRAFQFYEPGMDLRLRARLRLEQELRQALRDGDFELHFQPQVDVTDGRILGFEALVRWRHPTRGLVPPAEFIQLCEEIGLIAPLGEWVLRHACAQAAAWPQPLKVAVNLSPVQFRDRNLAQLVVSALAATGLDPRRLELEVTESVLLGGSAANVDLLHRLRGLGVGVALDDFGTGYSSLSYLHQFPFDKIKIDQSFVRAMSASPQALAIVETVVDLGRRLGITITAEGVETGEQLERLRMLGCGQVQGYLFSRPVPASAVSRMLAPQLPRAMVGERMS